MNIPGNAVMWQGIAAFLAAVLAVVSGISALKASWAQAARAQEQNAQAQDIKGWLTGGDSLAHLYPVLQKNAKGEDVAVSYHLKHHGSTYPVYDVEVRLQDLDNGPFLPDGSVIPSQVVRAGTLTSNTDKFTLEFLIFHYPKPGEMKPRRVRVELPARNGLVLQEITLTPFQGRWVTKSKPITKNHVPVDIDIEEVK